MSATEMLSIGTHPLWGVLKCSDLCQRHSVASTQWESFLSKLPNRCWSWEHWWTRNIPLFLPSRQSGTSAACPNSAAGQSPDWCTASVSDPDGCWYLSTAFLNVLPFLCWDRSESPEGLQRYPLKQSHGCWTVLVMLEHFGTKALAQGHFVEPHPWSVLSLWPACSPAWTGSPWVRFCGFKLKLLSGVGLSSFIS